MIYISTACIKKTKGIKETVETLYKSGFKNIELSGGNYEGGIEQVLLDFKKRYNLRYLCHNYFPPAKVPFVLNLASLSEDIYAGTLNHLKESIRLSRTLGAKRFGFHAGFFLDIPMNEIGKRISCVALNNKNLCMERFVKGYQELKSQSKEIELYLENNVVSQKNLETFQGQNPFMMTSFNEYAELKEKIDFKLLLDVGHLKVSCYSLGLNFENELAKLVDMTDYIHISNNDSFTDSNKELTLDSDLCKLLRQHNLKNKVITLEVYEGLESVQNSYRVMKELTNDREIILS